MEFQCPGFVIAAPASGSGKSTLTVGLMAAFSRTMRVQGFKIGPDYIDPMYHTIACGRSSVNLDNWILTEEQNRAVYQRRAAHADLCIVEGVMGLFDGISSCENCAATAGMANTLRLPIIFVIDGSKMAESAAAFLHGFNTFDPNTRIAGVIFNRVSTDRHQKLIRMAVEPLGIPILGFIPKNDKLKVPERNLGLFTVAEDEVSARHYITSAREIGEQYLDMDIIRRIAKTAGPQTAALPIIFPQNGKSVRLAVAQDAAFCFYYADNLDLLRAQGVEIILFSPLKDRALPDCIQGVYLGGGYPELHASKLAENRSMIESLRIFAINGGIVYAECGGMIYLMDKLRLPNSEVVKLCGLLNGTCELQPKLTIAYHELRALQPNWLIPMDLKVRSHEFHYALLKKDLADPALFELRDMENAFCGTDGFSYKNVIASWQHLHFGQNSALAINFMRAMLKGRMYV